MAEAQKGVFDHLAEYLLQPSAAGPASPPAAPDMQPLARSGKTLVETDTGEQTLVFVETAEKLTIEKELFVREEVVLSKLIENHVQPIDDQVRRTEVEIERIAPKEAERIGERNTHGDHATAALPQAASRPPPPAAPSQAERIRPQAPGAGQHSATWWLWFGLVLCAAVLIAFAVGQFLGSASG